MRSIIGEDKIRMLKLVLIGALVAGTVAQFDMNRMMMMMRMMPGIGSGTDTSGSGSRSSGSDTVIGNILNTAFLCSNTKDIRYIRCANANDVCNMISVATYSVPNLLKCSPMGIGCCFKDFQSMMMGNTNAPNN